MMTTTPLTALTALRQGGRFHDLLRRRGGASKGWKGDMEMRGHSYGQGYDQGDDEDAYGEPYEYGDYDYTQQYHQQRRQQVRRTTRIRKQEAW